MWLWSTLALAGGPCDPAAVAIVNDVLPTTDAAVRPGLAAAGVAEACPGTPLAETAAALNAVSPDQQRVIDLRLATTDVTSWIAACPGGPGALAAAVQQANAHAALWKPCALADTGWFVEEEWREATGPVVVPLVAGRTLAASGVPAFQVRAVVRALAGVSRDGGTPRVADGLVPVSETPVLDLPELEPPPTGTEAGFTRGGRVAPEWSKAARDAGGSCTATIGVTPEGTLRKITWTDCPEALRKDVEKAIGRSTLAPATRDGAPAPGRFEATWKVR